MKRLIGAVVASGVILTLALTSVAQLPLEERQDLYQQCVVEGINKRGGLMVIALSKELLARVENTVVPKCLKKYNLVLTK